MYRISNFINLAGNFRHEKELIDDAISKKNCNFAISISGVNTNPINYFV